MTATRSAAPRRAAGCLRPGARSAGRESSRISRSTRTIASDASRRVPTAASSRRTEGAPLARADDELDVERRTAEETAEPLPGE